MAATTIKLEDIISTPEFQTAMDSAIVRIAGEDRQMDYLTDKVPFKAQHSKTASLLEEILEDSRIKNLKDPAGKPDLNAQIKKAIELNLIPLPKEADTATMYTKIAALDGIFQGPEITSFVKAAEKIAISKQPAAAPAEPQTTTPVQTSTPTVSETTPVFTVSATPTTTTTISIPAPPAQQTVSPPTNTAAEVAKALALKASQDKLAELKKDHTALKAEAAKGNPKFNKPLLNELKLFETEINDLQRTEPTDSLFAAKLDTAREKLDKLKEKEESLKSGNITKVDQALESIKDPGSLFGGGLFGAMVTMLMDAFPALKNWYNNTFVKPTEELQTNLGNLANASQLLNKDRAGETLDNNLDIADLDAALEKGMIDKGQYDKIKTALPALQTGQLSIENIVGAAVTPMIAGVAKSVTEKE